MSGPDHKQRVLLPGSTIGILGGGQLGRMMAIAGRQLGYRFVTLDPTEDSPCGQVADRQIRAGYADAEAARLLAECSDVITYEFENVDSAVTEMLTGAAYVPQGSELLYTTQHRLREKAAIEAAGATVAPYARVESLEQLKAGIAEFGVPCVLKTATGGYDGKGQWVIRSTADAEAAEAYEALGKAKTDLVLEKFIRFDKEISVIAARNPRGEIKTFPVAENIHIDNILHASIVPARISDQVRQKAEQLATGIAGSMNVIGLIAVEMFLTIDGELFVNELAPRPHNSGHYTMDACATSQFEQHIRAVCNLPLQSTELLTPVVMVNLLGEHIRPLLDWMPEESGGKPQGGEHPIAVKVHLYGKKEALAKRKMGHVNVLAKTVEAALDWIDQSSIWRS